MALIPDDDDEELIEKAKANRKQRLSEQRDTAKEFVKTEGFNQVELVSVQRAVNKLAKSAAELEAGNLPAVAAIVGYVLILKNTSSLHSLFLTINSRLLKSRRLSPSVLSGSWPSVLLSWTQQSCQPLLLALGMCFFCKVPHRNISNPSPSSSVLSGLLSLVTIFPVKLARCAAELDAGSLPAHAIAGYVLLDVLFFMTKSCIPPSLWACLVFHIVRVHDSKGTYGLDVVHIRKLAKFTPELEAGN